MSICMSDTLYLNSNPDKGPKIFSPIAGSLIRIIADDVRTKKKMGK